MKTKTENKFKYATQEELLAQFKEEKNYLPMPFFLKGKWMEKFYFLKEFSTWVAITCLLLVGFIFLF